MNSSIQAAIFDFDGTLADTFPAIHAAWNAAMEPIFGRTFSRDEVIERFGPSDEGMMARELENFPFHTLQSVTEVYYRAYEAASDQTRAFEGIADLLHELEKRGIPCAVMTGKGRRAAEISLRYLGWEEKFAVLVTGTEITNPKPAPDGPLLAAQMLGIAPHNCLYIGDSPADLGAARAAQMKPVVAGWHSYFLPQLREMNAENWANHPADVLLFLD